MVKPTKCKLSYLSAAILGVSATSQVCASPAILEEVLVTTQFVEQNLQETPVAVTAITADALDVRGHQTVDDISAQAPNVTLTTGGGFSGPSLIGFIRGVGQTDFNPALEAGVGLYVDDVYYSQLSGSVLELLDLERVEVLRGPQGTLAGKNSIGGAIKLYSQRPDGQSNGYIEMGNGSFNSVNVRAATNFTLIEDALFARISGVSRAQDGYVTRLDYNCANSNNAIPELDSYLNVPTCKTGEDGGSDYTGGRLALRWLASDDVEINFSTEKVNNTLGAAPNILIGTYGTDSTAENRQLWDTYRERFVPEEGQYITYGTYVDSRSNLVIQDEMRVESNGSTLNIDWSLSDTLQFQSITGLRKFETAFGTDLDGSPIPILQQYQVLTHKQTSQEFRFNGEFGSALDYTVGAFFFDAHTELSARVDLGYSGAELDFLHGPDPVDVTNTALFANVIMYPSDNIDVTLGWRYSTDEKDYGYHRRNPDLSAVQPCNGAPGAPGTNSNCVLNGLDGLTSKFEDKRSDLRLATSYKFTDDMMAYYQYATGFKGGGVNPRPFYTEQASPFDPEELTSHEIGFKVQLLDDTMRINTAVFQNTYDGVQLSLLDCTAYFPTAGVPCLAPKNAGDADVNGFEIEVDYRPMDNWLIEASLSTLDFTYTAIDPATGILDSWEATDENGDPVLDGEGNAVIEYAPVSSAKETTPFTPALTWSLSSQFDFNSGFGQVSPRIDASYQDEVQTASAISEYGQIDERTLVNASLSLTSKEEDWRIRFEIRNITNEFYYTNKTDAPSSLHAYGLAGMPKNWNMSFKYMF